MVMTWTKADGSQKLVNLEFNLDHADVGVCGSQGASAVVETQRSQRWNTAAHRGGKRITYCTCSKFYKEEAWHSTTLLGKGSVDWLNAMVEEKNMQLHVQGYGVKRKGKKGHCIPTWKRHPKGEVGWKERRDFSGQLFASSVPGQLATHRGGEWKFPSLSRYFYTIMSWWRSASWSSV